MNIADCNVNETNSSEIEISLLKQKIKIDFGTTLDLDKNENYFLELDHEVLI